jgi:hypothetical protein
MGIRTITAVLAFAIVATPALSCGAAGGGFTVSAGQPVEITVGAEPDPKRLVLTIGDLHEDPSDPVQMRVFASDPQGCRQLMSRLSFFGKPAEGTMEYVVPLTPSILDGLGGAPLALTFEVFTADGRTTSEAQVAVEAVRLE